jgi:hypothetical protein
LWVAAWPMRVFPDVLPADHSYSRLRVGPRTWLRAETG